MKKKYEKAVQSVLKGVDKFLEETLKGEDGQRRRWIQYPKSSGPALSTFNVYVRVPRGPRVDDHEEPTSRDTLDIATIEAFPTKEGMGTMFFDHIEGVAKARNMRYLRVESVLAPELIKILERKDYKLSTTMGQSYWKKLF